MSKGTPVTVERKVGGIVLLSAIVGGQMMKRRYVGYPVKKACSLFNRVLSDEIMYG